VKHPARIAAAMAAIALGAQAAPALAGGFTLNLAPQSEAVVGQPLIVQATGTVPPEDVWLPYWFSLDAIPTAVATTCPADRWVGVQFAQDNGGAVVVLSQSEKPDSAGNFAIPVAVTPTAPGTVLLCGYTDDGEASTLAGASLLLNIKPAPSSPSTPSTPSAPSTPSNPSGSGGSRRPSPAEYARQGVRSCRALMSGADAKSCIRDIVRQANARCRRLHSRHSRTRCLKAVRRASKHAIKPR
jgi:hypothetical protein